jgi:hypothetical protein
MTLGCRFWSSTVATAGLGAVTLTLAVLVFLASQKRGAGVLQSSWAL